MNPAPRGQGQRRRRGLLFTVTPIVAAVLIVVAMVAVVVHTLHKSPPAADPTAFRSSSTHSTAPVTTTTTTATPTPTTTPDDPQLAAQAVQAVDALHVPGVQYGIAILDRNSGQETLGTNGATPIWSASVVKLFVVVDLLHQQEQGAVTLDSNAQYDIMRCLELSDDNAMDSLWVRFNGPALVSQIADLAGLKDTTLDASDPGEWGETLISPRDVISIWQYALTKLSPADTALIVNDTHNAQNNGADGFDQAFGLLDPPRETTVKAKQGWMIGGDTMILNTTGALGTNDQYLVAILTKQNAGIGYPQGRANVNAASSLVEKALAPGTS